MTVDVAIGQHGVWGTIRQGAYPAPDELQQLERFHDATRRHDVVIFVDVGRWAVAIRSHDELVMADHEDVTFRWRPFGRSKLTRTTTQKPARLVTYRVADRQEIEARPELHAAVLLVIGSEYPDDLYGPDGQVWNEPSYGKGWGRAMGSVERGDLARAIEWLDRCGPDSDLLRLLAQEWRFRSRRALRVTSPDLLDLTFTYLTSSVGVRKAVGVLLAEQPRHAHLDPAHSSGRDILRVAARTPPS